mgnify:CR=1 FL=1
MLVVFGGFISGLSIAIALKAGASTGGTDFISLLVANRTGKTIWGFIFASNCALLVIFGALFGWENAAYSIVFQFIATKTIDSFYHRYDRVTLQITTKRADEVMDATSRASSTASAAPRSSAATAASACTCCTPSCPPTSPRTSSSSCGRLTPAP